MAAISKETLAVVLGAIVVSGLAVASASITGPRLSSRLSAEAAIAIERAGAMPVKASFFSGNRWPTRHPLLSGGEKLDDGTRARAARAVAAVPGVGGIRWIDGSTLAKSAAAPQHSVDCQEDVAGLLRARTIRFEEGSARVDQASSALIDEVAAALRPCLGSIIAITGHTDASGPEPGNLTLSRLRADAVRDELLRRGIPADGLRASGVGSRVPVEGLDAADPANRRIEFSVVATEAVRPTPVDTPGPN